MLPNAIGSGQVDDAFAAANPRGEVPALLDGDAAIFDSTVILEYVEDKWPAPAMLPPTPAERARVRMLEDVMDTHFEAITWALSEIRNFGRAEGAKLRGSKRRRGRVGSLVRVAGTAARQTPVVQRRCVRLGRSVRDPVRQRRGLVRPYAEARFVAGGLAVARQRARQCQRVSAEAANDGDAGRQRWHGGGTPSAAGGSVQTRISRPSARVDDPQRRARRRSGSASSAATSVLRKRSAADARSQQMLDVLYRSADLLAINKPSGMSLLADRSGAPCLWDELREELR